MPVVKIDLLEGHAKKQKEKLRMLRKEFPALKSRLPTLWTRSYFVSTHGHISDRLIQKYIGEQKGI